MTKTPEEQLDEIEKNVVRLVAGEDLVRGHPLMDPEEKRLRSGALVYDALEEAKSALKQAYAEHTIEPDRLGPLMDRIAAVTNTLLTGVFGVTDEEIEEWITKKKPVEDV